MANAQVKNLSFLENGRGFFIFYMLDTIFLSGQDTTDPLALCWQSALLQWLPQTTSSWTLVNRTTMMQTFSDLLQNLSSVVWGNVVEKKLHPSLLSTMRSLEDYETRTSTVMRLMWIWSDKYQYFRPVNPLCAGAVQKSLQNYLPPKKR